MNDSSRSQLQWLVDRGQIGDLLCRFASSIDARDCRSLKESFAEGGRLELPLADSPACGILTIGKEHMEERLPALLGKARGAHHISVCHQIAIDGEAAKVRFYLQAIPLFPQAVPWEGAGWCESACLHTSDGWKFTSVQLNALRSTGGPLPMRADI